MGERSHGLQSWIECLNEAELPALAVVVQDLHQMAQTDKSSVQQLAAVLLRDASLTSKVLKVANSVYYNPSQEPIRTISRAIVLIGFENVRLIGLSVSLIDNLLTRTSREQLPALLARSFHAAVQARNIAGYLLARSQEEVFIAALLHNLGELAFWGCGGELASLLAQPGVEEEQAVLEVLGTSFRQLTQDLVRSWSLGELASLAHSGSAQGDPAVKAVSLGMRISEAAHARGAGAGDVLHRAAAGRHARNRGAQARAVHVLPALRPTGRPLSGGDGAEVPGLAVGWR